MASPPPESVSKSQMAFPLASIPGPRASQRPRPGHGRENAASVLGPGGFATISSGLEVQGWLAKLSVTPQPPLQSPTLDPIQPVLHAGFILLG